MVDSYFKSESKQ